MSDAAFNMEVGRGIFDELKKLREEFTSLREKVEDVEETSESMKKSLKTISFVSITEGIRNVADELKNTADPGLKYNASLKELSAMSEISGKQLDNLGKMARQNALDFGGNGAKSIETFKLLLAQLGPELAKQPEVLNEMARNAETLSKSMSGDVVGAAGVLSTAMQQYEVDLTNAKQAQKEMTVMMNAMAASANAGSSELPQLQAAVGVAGGAAKRAGLEFEQMLTAIQFLDKASYKSAEGGTALRNVLEQLSKGRFLPEKVQDELSKAGIDINKLADNTVSFTDKLRMLKPIAEDTALIGALFGGPYSGAAQALIATADAQDQMTESIKGTNEAQRYAATMMESDEEKLARWQARVDDMKVSLYELTGGTLAYLVPLSEAAREVSSFIPLASAMSSGYTKIKNSQKAKAIATKAATAAQWLWNAAMNANPLGLIVATVAAATAGIYALAKGMNVGTAAQKANNAVNERAIDIASDEMVQLKMLTGSIKSAKEGTDARRKAINELRDVYPDILKKYKDEELTNEKINQLHKEIANNVMLRAKREAAAELYKEKLKEQAQAELKGPSTGDIAKASFASGNLFGAVDQKTIESTIKQAVSNQKNRVKDLSKEADQFHNMMMDLDKKLGVIPSSESASPTESDQMTIPNLATSKADKKSSTSTSTSSSGSSGSGSSERRNISVKIDRLVENLIIQTSSIKEGAADIKQQVSEALIGAVRDFEVAI